MRTVTTSDPAAVRGVLKAFGSHSDLRFENDTLASKSGPIAQLQNGRVLIYESDSDVISELESLLEPLVR